MFVVVYHFPILAVEGKERHLPTQTGKTKDRKLLFSNQETLGLVIFAYCLTTVAV